MERIHRKNTLKPETHRTPTKKHAVLTFCVLAYAGSWLISIPYILSEWGIINGDFRWAFTVKPFAGPFFAAFFLTRKHAGIKGVTQLRKQMLAVKAGLSMYLGVLFGLPILLTTGICAVPGAIAGFTGLTPAFFISYPLYFAAVFIAGGPLGEEPGWRGFALPEMQRLFGPLKGTFLLGIIWTGWHLPDFLTSAQGGGPGIPLSTILINLILFFFLIEAMSILLTWIYNTRQQSLFLVMLAHASINTTQLGIVPMFPTLTISALNAVAAGVFGLCALVLIAGTKGVLGYQCSIENSKQLI